MRRRHARGALLLVCKGGCAQLANALVLIGLGGVSHLQASIYSLTPSEQLFVSLSNDLVVNGTSSIRGTVGLAGTGSALTIQSTAAIRAISPYTGEADFSTSTAPCSGTGCPGSVQGGLKTNVANVTTAFNDYNNLVTTLMGLSGGTNVAINPGVGGQTLSTPGIYNVSTFNMAGGNLTLSGTATDQYVIRVTSNTPTITSGSILLTGGLQPDNVIFLFEPSQTNTNITWNSSGQFSGILLGSPNISQFSFSNTLSTSSVGRVVTTSSTGLIQFNGGGFTGAGALPEPSTVGLVGLGLAIVALKRRAARASPD